MQKERSSQKYNQQNNSSEMYTTHVEGQNPTSKNQYLINTLSQQRRSNSQQSSDVIKKKIKIEQQIQLKDRQTKANTLIQDHHNQNQDLTCKICMEGYNLNRKMPIIACQNKHVFCLQCIIKSLYHKNQKCPLCRVIVGPIQKEQKIFALLLNNTQKQLNSINLVKFKLKISKKQSKLSDFKQIDKNTFAKNIQNDMWSYLVFQKLPTSLKYNKKSLKTLQKQSLNEYIMQFRYQKSVKNCLSFGLFLYDQFTQSVIQNVGFESHLFQHFSKKNKNSDTMYNTTDIILIVNLHKKSIKWMSSKNKIIAQQILSVRGVGEISYKPYIALMKKGDLIKI